MKYSIILAALISVIFNSCNNPCASVECLNNGICVEGTCECPEGFTGQNCETNMFAQKRLLRFEERIDGNGYYKIEYTYDQNNNIESRQVIDENNNILGGWNFYFANDTLFQDRWTDFETQEIRRREKLFQISGNQYQRDDYNLGPNGLEYSQSSTYIIENNCGVLMVSNPSIVITNEFSDENCSHVATTLNSSNQLINLVSILRDSKNSNCLDRFCHFYDHSFGNTTNFEIADLNTDPTGNTPIQGSSYNAEFIFNENGYPTLETRNYYDGSVRQYQYSYY